MLILTRRVNESIVIGDNIRIRVAAIGRWGEVKLAIEAPKEVTVHREEIYNKIGATPVVPHPSENVDQEIAALLNKSLP